MPETLRFSRRLELAAAPERLWPLLADTDRINRAVGLPAVRYEAPDERLRRAASARAYGLLPMRWLESPFEWVENQHYAVRRDFVGGPWESVEAGLRLLPQGGSTLLELFAQVRPRHLMGGLLARLGVGRRGLDGLAELCRRIERSVQGGQGEPFERRSGRGRVRTRALRNLLARLRGRAPQGPLEQLALHLRRGFDEEVVRMRPFALADRWGLDRFEVLRAFLHAARAGLLDVSWDVLCPNCRVAKSSHFTLAELKNSVHCDTCRIDFSSEFDRNVEIRFTVNPAVRGATDAVFCVGGPGNAPHRLAQLRLGPGASRALRLELPPRRLYLRGLTGTRRLCLKPDPSAGQEPLALALEDDEAGPGELAFRPGSVELRLDNHGGECWIGLDEESWTEQAATAALVTALQDFRDLFSSEVLSPGQEVSIRSLAVLFTDIKGSTALYERVGDAHAYALVREHFRILHDAVRERRGAVVKTIGDAIMAVFHSTEDAAGAACLIQRRFAERNGSRPRGEEDLVVKLGLHAGPAIVVNTAGALDYFGTTVNVAARVQAESVGADIVVSQAVLDGAAGELRRGCRAPEPFEVELKGLSERFRLWRLWPLPPSP